MFLEGRQWQVVGESSIRAVCSYWLWSHASSIELFCGSLLNLRFELFALLFLWPLCLVNWGLFSTSIFSKSLNSLLDSTFSVLCIFCFDVDFCLSLRTFLFGEVSVKVGSLMGDLLSLPAVKNSLSIIQDGHHNPGKATDQGHAIVTDDRGQEEPIVAPMQVSRSNIKASPKSGFCTRIVCYNCNGQDHIVRDCASRRQWVRVCCYHCNKVGHMAQDCSGDKDRDKIALVSSPDKLWMRRCWSSECTSMRHHIQHLSTLAALRLL